jgi:hypothetical protein
MINRRNWKDVQEHLDYRADVHRDAESTQVTRRSSLRLLLRWADATLLGEAPGIRPTLPVWLARQPGRDARMPAQSAGSPAATKHPVRRLAPSTQENVLSTVRVFYRWALIAHPRRYRQVTPLWLDSLCVVPQPSQPDARDVYTVDEVRALAGVEAGTMALRRVQAVDESRRADEAQQDGDDVVVGRAGSAGGGRGVGWVRARAAALAVDVVSESGRGARSEGRGGGA